VLLILSERLYYSKLSKSRDKEKKNSLNNITIKDWVV
jgi:hypothetical protein